MKVNGEGRCGVRVRVVVGRLLQKETVSSQNQQCPYAQPERGV